MEKRSILLYVLVLVFSTFSHAWAYEALSGPTQLIQYKASKAYEGYTLITPMNADKTYLIDMLGYIVHTWEHKTKPPGMHFVLLENGHLLGNTGSEMMQAPPGERGAGMMQGSPPGERGAGMMQNPPGERGAGMMQGSPTGQPGAGRGQQPPGNNQGQPPSGDNDKMSFGGAARGLIELDWDGNIIWEWEPGDSDGTIHHDFVRLPNGNTLCNAWEAISYEDAIAAGRRADQTTERGVGVDVIYEVDPGGNIVWRWSSWDHRGMNSESHLDVNYITYVLPEHSRNNPDWTHFNDVDYDPDTDRILVSSREFGEIYIIDHKTGDILYRWGNPSAYGAGATPTFITPGEQILFGPHDAHWIKEGLPGAGNILIFNNGWARPPITYSSIIEMNPDTGEIVWEYKSGSETSFASHHISSAQRLLNGNTMICSGNGGHLFEVTPEKEVVWEYISPVMGKSTTNRIEDGNARDGNARGGNGVFRAHRYGPDYPGLEGRDLKPKGQIEDDLKGGWLPSVDLEGATQQGAKLWKKLWE